jgi:hypothetical protein
MFCVLEKNFGDHGSRQEESQAGTKRDYGAPLEEDECPEIDCRGSVSQRPRLPQHS